MVRIFSLFIFLVTANAWSQVFPDLPKDVFPEPRRDGLEEKIVELRGALKVETLKASERASFERELLPLLYYSGKWNKDQGDLEDGLALAQKMPRSSLRERWIAVFQLGLGQYVQALRSFENTEVIDPSANVQMGTWFHTFIGEESFEIKKDLLAIKYLNLALETPNEATQSDLRWKLIQSYVRNKMWAEAWRWSLQEVQDAKSKNGAEVAKTMGKLWPPLAADHLPFDAFAKPNWQVLFLERAIFEALQVPGFAYIEKLLTSILTLKEVKARENLLRYYLSSKKDRSYGDGLKWILEKAPQGFEPEVVYVLKERKDIPEPMHVEIAEAYLKAFPQGQARSFVDKTLLNLYLNNKMFEKAVLLRPDTGLEERAFERLVIWEVWAKNNTDKISDFERGLDDYLKRFPQSPRASKVASKKVLTDYFRKKYKAILNDQNVEKILMKTGDAELKRIYIGSLVQEALDRVRRNDFAGLEDLYGKYANRSWIDFKTKQSLQYEIAAAALEQKAWEALYKFLKREKEKNNLLPNAAAVGARAAFVLALDGEYEEGRRFKEFLKPTQKILLATLDGKNMFFNGEALLAQVKTGSASGRVLPPNVSQLEREAMKLAWPQLDKNIPFVRKARLRVNRILPKMEESDQKRLLKLMESLERVTADWIVKTEKNKTIANRLQKEFLAQAEQYKQTLIKIQEAENYQLAESRAPDRFVKEKWPWPKSYLDKEQSQKSPWRAIEKWISAKEFEKALNYLEFYQTLAPKTEVLSAEDYLKARVGLMLRMAYEKDARYREYVFAYLKQNKREDLLKVWSGQ